MAGNDIYLRSVPSDTDQDDIRLYDPTTADAGGGGDAVFVGATTLTFSQTGDLNAGATIAGATTVTFSQTGAFGGGATFAGSAAIAFSQTGDFNAGATFAGVTTITFSQTGDFIAGAGAGAAVFVGATTITFSQTGELISGATLEGAAAITFSASGDFVADGGSVPVNEGDDVKRHRGVRPLPQIRPKVERDLDDALGIIETIAPERRVKENKTAAREALAAIRAVEISISFAEPIDKIEKALKKLSRNTAKHEGMQEAAMRIAAELEAVIAEMERRRKRQQRDEEAILWLLS